MPLTYADRGQAQSGTQFSVLAGGVYIGSINKTMQSIMVKDVERWDWRLNSHYGPVGYLSNGRASSLADAKAELERNWMLWLAAVQAN
jgi:hypothetical protein